jgi:hypothetical protein
MSRLALGSFGISIAFLDLPEPREYPNLERIFGGYHHGYQSNLTNPYEKTLYLSQFSRSLRNMTIIWVLAMQKVEGSSPFIRLRESRLRQWRLRGDSHAAVV